MVNALCRSDSLNETRLRGLSSLIRSIKPVDKSKVCVHPELAQAYTNIVRRMTASHDLLTDDAE